MRRRCLSLFVLPALSTLLACGSATSQAEPTAGSDVSDALVERADMNNDGRPDLSRYYAPGANDSEKKLLRLEVDLNFDGRTDKTNHYNPETGKLTKVELNWDFDRNVDMIEIYDADGNLETQEIDRDFNGKLDVLKRYKGGLLYSRQIDADGNGTWDVWEYFSKKGDVYRLGRDQDGDGKPEFFEDVKKK